MHPVIHIRTFGFVLCDFVTAHFAFDCRQTDREIDVAVFTSSPSHPTYIRLPTSHCSACSCSFCVFVYVQIDRNRIHQSARRPSSLDRTRLVSSLAPHTKYSFWIQPPSHTTLTPDIVLLTRLKHLFVFLFEPRMYLYINSVLCYFLSLRPPNVCYWTVQ